MNLFSAGYGILGSAAVVWVIPVAAALAVALGFVGAPLWIWTLAASVLLFGPVSRMNGSSRFGIGDGHPGSRPGVGGQGGSMCHIY